MDFAEYCSCEFDVQNMKHIVNECSMGDIFGKGPFSWSLTPILTVNDLGLALWRNIMGCFVI